MFDINKLAIVDSADFHVTDAKGEPQYDESGNPITITIASPGTKQAAQAMFEHKEKTSARFTAAIGGKAEKRTEAEERKERAALLAKVTVGLNGFSYQGGAEALYAHPKLKFVADGVDKFYGEMGNFAPPSTPASSSTSDTQPG